MTHYVFSGGGTGGGVYPGIAILRALQMLDPDCTVEWIGSRAGIEGPMIEREGIAFLALPGGPVAGVGARALISAVLIALGTAQAWARLGRSKPAALLITGGWPSVAPALAAWLRRIPVMIYLPDLEPTGAIKALQRIASVVAVNAEISKGYFRPGRAVVTGYPLRPQVLAAAGFDALGRPMEADARAQARAHFRLPAERPCLLVTGGSRGARSINLALLPILPELLETAEVIHITGERGADEALDPQSLPVELRRHYHAFAYLHSEEMALALAAADLVIARAGASVLGEFPTFGLPAILVPYPFAWRYQKSNAEYLVSQGAARALADEQLSAELGPLTLSLLRDEAERARLSASARALARPAAAAQAARLLIEQRQGLR